MSEIFNLEINGREVEVKRDDDGKFIIPDKFKNKHTALKPSHECIVVAQKPYENTYAENVLKYGVGGLNIDGCRIDTDENLSIGSNNHSNADVFKHDQDIDSGQHPQGRWPANVVLDPVSAEMLDRQSGHLESGEPMGIRGSSDKNVDYADIAEGSNLTGYGDKGGASRFFKTAGFNSSEISDLRFFYSAKAHKSERNAGLQDLQDRESSATNQNHKCKKCGKYELMNKGAEGNVCECDNPEWTKPVQKNDIATLKPINLMRWLCRLVTPEDGTVLDPFAGSGTTGCACEIEGFDYILIEKRERFAKAIAPKRCDYWSDPSNWGDLKEHEEVPDPKELRNGKLSEFTT